MQSVYLFFHSYVTHYRRRLARLVDSWYVCTCNSFPEYFTYIPGSNINPGYKWKVAAVCGGLQILLGCFSVAFNAVAIAVVQEHNVGIFHAGFGIWSPVLVRRSLDTSYMYVQNVSIKFNSSWYTLSYVSNQWRFKPEIVLPSLNKHLLLESVVDRQSTIEAKFVIW